MGEVTLVLSNQCPLHFHSLHIIDESGNERKYATSCLITVHREYFWAESYNVFLEYLSYSNSIELYRSETGGLPLYAENIGDDVIYIYLSGLKFSLAAGEKKALAEENADSNAGDS